MGTLHVGRLGFDVELGDPASWMESRGLEQRDFSLRGYIKSTSLANTKYLRTELLEQQNSLVAVTYSLDAYFDGFYWLSDVKVESIEASYLRRGLFPFELTLIRLGSVSRIELQSLLTYTTLDNAHGVIGSGSNASEAWHALPASHYLYEGNANLGSVTRVSESGTMRVYRQVQIASIAGTDDGTPDPTWGIEPSDFYDGAAYVKVDGSLRAGLDAPNSPDNWELGNGIIKVTSSATSRINVATWGGSAYDTAKVYLFSFDEGTPAEIPAWGSFNIVRNDPECSIIRLIADNAIAGGAFRHYVDLTMRRGAATVYGNWKYSNGNAGAVDLTFGRASAEGATAVTPTGATSAVGIRATVNDGDGNRYTLGTRHAHTQDLTNGRVTRDHVDNVLHFYVGSAIDGSGAAAGNDPSALAMQYLGWISEKVRAVLR